MAVPNNKDHLLNALNDGDKQLALKLAKEISTEQIKPEHIELAVELYEESHKKFDQFLKKGGAKDELVETLVKKASDQTLQIAHNYASRPKSIEQQFDEELGDIEINHKADRVKALTEQFTAKEVKIREDNKLAQEDPLLHAIKGNDKYAALEVIKNANPEQIKEHHLKAAIEEYYQGSGEMIASTVRSTEGSIVKAVAEKTSDEILLKNQKHEIKKAVYEWSDDGMPTLDKVSDAKHVEVKAVTAELNRRGIGKSGHADSVTKQRISNTAERS